MSKKLITACMALFALAAFILPATASAAPELTHPTGKTLAAPANIVATNVGTTNLRDGTPGNVVAECTKVVMKGSLVKNTGTVIEGNITTATFTGTGTEKNVGMPECTSTFGGITVTTNGGGTDGENVVNGTPWCIKATTAGSYSVRGGLCSEAAREIRFIMDSTTVGECKYKRTTAITGTNTTDNGADPGTLTLSPTASTTFTGEAGNSFFCPAEGTLEMSYRLETENGETIYIS